MAIAVMTVVVLTGAASAADFEIHPPTGCSATTITTAPDGGSYAEVSIDDDPEARCQVTFHPAGPGGGQSQADLNAKAANPDDVDVLKSGLRSVFDVLSIGRFEMQGVVGLAIVAVPKDGNGEVRTLIVALATPRGLTGVGCVGPTARFAMLRPRFDAIVRGVTLHR